MSIHSRLERALDLLRSTKIKERQEGIVYLKNIFSQPLEATRYHRTQIRDKRVKAEQIWAPILNGLETCIRSEKTAVTTAKKSSDSAEKRLSEAAGVYRTLITHTITLLPRKLVVSVWEFLHKGMRRRKELHSAVALHFIRALECVASHAAHLIRLEDENYEQSWLNVLELGFNIVLRKPLTTQIFDVEPSSPDNSEMFEDDDSLAMETYEENQASPDKKRKRDGLTPIEAGPSQPRQSLGPISSEQVAAMSLLSVLLSSNSAPILRIRDCSSAILRSLKSFLDLYHSDTSLHHDFLRATLSTLRHLSLNRRNEVVEFARSTWDQLLDLWGTKNKVLKEVLVSILRLLFPYFTATDVDPVTLAGLSKMWNLMSGGVEKKWAVEPLSLETIRLEAAIDNDDASQSQKAFKAKTFCAGPQFEVGHALTWAILELQADCAARLHIYFDSSPLSSQPTQSSKISRLLENPLAFLMRSIRSTLSVSLRIHDLQILLFFIDRHWHTVHDSMQSEIIRTLLEFVSSDDGGIQSWTFLCLAAIAYADCSDRTPQVHPSSPSNTTSVSGSLPRGASIWDSVWTHAIRRTSSPQVCRAACHTASVLLVYAHSNPAQRSLVRSPLTSHRVLAEIESLAKELDVQGPSGPCDSVCNFLSHCLRVANQDVRLYRMQLEEKVLTWLLDTWKPAHVDSSENHPALASDILLLLETICASSQSSSLLCRVSLPVCLTAETLIAEEQTRVIREFLLDAKLPTAMKKNDHYMPRSTSKESLDSGNSSFSASILSEPDLVQPRGRERKVSAFFLRSLESLMQNIPSNGSSSRADAAKKALELAVISLSFESVLVMNGIQVNRRVVQAACKLISSISLFLERNQWTLEEKELILRALEPLAAVDVDSYNDPPWTVLLPPTKSTGIRAQTLKSLLSDIRRHRDSSREARVKHLKILWRNADVQSTFNTVLVNLRNLLRITMGKQPVSPVDALSVDDSFSVGHVRIPLPGAPSQDTTQNSVVRSVAGACIAFLCVGPLLQVTSGQPIRDNELTELMLDCVDTDIERFLLVCPAYFDNIRNKRLEMTNTNLASFLTHLSQHFQSYPLQRREDFNLQLVSFLDATLSSWIALVQENKEEDIVDNFGHIAHYYSVSLRNQKNGFWRVRDAIARLFDRYLLLDPSQKAWTRDDSPHKTLLLLIKDDDIRIRFRLSAINARLLDLTPDPMALYAEMRELYAKDLSQFEHILTRILSLGNIMVVSSAVRRGPYWHLVETAFYSDVFNRHIESTLVGVAQRLGLKSLAELLEAYAYQLAYSIRQAGQNVLSLPVSLLGYKDLKERANQTIRHFTPANLLVTGVEKDRKHGRSLFEGHCHAIQKSPEEVVRECFGDIVGFQILASLDRGEDSSEKLECGILKTLGTNDPLAFRESLRIAVNGVVTSILRTLSEQDFTENGTIVEALRAVDESSKSAQLFSILTRHRRIDDIATHRHNLPLFSPFTILGALRWLLTEVPGSDNYALTYHVLQELFAAVQRSFLVNEQIRLVNAISLWVASRHAITGFEDATLLHVLIRGAVSLLGQWDLVPAAQSILEWCFSLYISGNDPRFPDVIIRVACICYDYAADAEEDDVIGKNKCDALIEWVDDQTHFLACNTVVAEQVKLALPAWPHEPSPKLLPLFDDIDPMSLSRVLADKYISSNKFRLVRRLRDQAQLSMHDNSQFSQTDFWKLKECMPPADQLREEDVHAFASLLVLNQGSISSFGSDPEPKHVLHPSGKSRQQKEFAVTKLQTPESAFIHILLTMLEDHDDDGSRHAAYQTLRSVISTLSMETFEALSQIWPPEYRMEVNYLREFPPSPILRDIPNLSMSLSSAELTNAAQNFPIWISSITTLIADMLSATNLFYAQLCGILASHTTFASRVLPLLVQTLLQSSEGVSHSKSLSRYFEDLLSSTDTAVPCRQSIIDVVLHLRHIKPEGGDALAYNKWLDIGFLPLSQNAIACGAYTTALLFLELNAEYRDPSVNDDVSIEHIMYEIYRNIDEPDGFYAIRTQDHHQFLMRRFHHEKEWEKAFRFHGAALETDAGNPSEIEGLLQSFHSYGFNHIATKTLLDSHQEINSSMAYQLGWRAETWDLPESDDGRFPGASLYLALRAVHRERDQGVTDAVIRHVLFKEMDHIRALGSENISQIREAIQTLMALSQATQWRSFFIQDILASKDADIQKWSTFTTVEDGFRFDDVESIMATRISLIKSARRREQRHQIGNMLSSFGRTLLEVEKKCLLRLSQAAREAHQVQVALNSVIRAKNLEHLSSPSVTEEFASVLWAHKEQKHAVEYLTDLRRDAHDSDPIWLAQVIARLGAWSAEACLEQPSDIKQEFFDQAISMIKNVHENESRASVYHQYAKFAESQYKTALDSPELLRLNMYRERKEQERKHYEQVTRGKSDKALVNRLSAVKKVLAQDSKAMTDFISNRDASLKQAVQMYSLCLEASNKFDEDVSIQFCSLWLSNFDYDIIQDDLLQALGRIPSHKFVFLAHQIFSRIDDKLTRSQKTLRPTVIRMCSEHPFHSLYQLYCLQPSKTSQKARGSARISGGKELELPPTGRALTAQQFFKQLLNDPSTRARTAAVEELCDASLTFANYPVPKTDRKVPDTQPIRNLRLSRLSVPVITAYTSIDPTTRYDPSECVCVDQYAHQFDTAGGVNLPKIINCIGSDGRKYKQLFKGDQRDDLRQDAVMEQVFDLVNVVLRRDGETKRRNLHIRGYKVIPLASQAGILEFVTNTTTLKSWLDKAHPRYRPNDITSIGRKFKEYYENNSRSNIDRHRFYTECVENFQPVMRHYFTETHKTPIAWFRSRLNYTRSVATTSIVGHVLGLGDRHTSNILIDNSKGEIVHIDLGVAFDQGKLLPVPETVPFRMTPDMVDGMGISKTDGVFKRCAEETLRVLRDGSDVIMTVLQVFRYDPLYNWTMSDYKMKKQVEVDDSSMATTILSKNADAERIFSERYGIGINMDSTRAQEDADRALMGVSTKLSGNLSVAAAVRSLVAEATNTYNLGTIFYAPSTRIGHTGYGYGDIVANSLLLLKTSNEGKVLCIVNVTALRVLSDLESHVLRISHPKHHKLTMPFGEIVCGSPGSGKSTYCFGKHQLFTALKRPIHIVNLDPANDNIPYPCSIDISSLITLQDVMDEHGLGPNGGLLYCMEYLETNFDWLEERLKELDNEDGRSGDSYVLFDLPGQVELSTNHESIKRVVDRLQSKCGFRLAAVHLCDAHYVTDAAKYISVLLLSLRTMLQLELPHINVLSKIDLIGNYGDLDFNLDFYTEVQDLSYLENSLSSSLSPRFQALNTAMISLIEDYGLVGFETLAVEDRSSMLHLTHAIDRATGYVFLPPPSSSAGQGRPEGTIDESHKPVSAQPNEYGLFSSAAGPLKNTLSNSSEGVSTSKFASEKDVYDVRDVQERWIDAKDAWDAFEKREWRREGEMIRDQVARAKAAGK
ncbi:hypothetical protein D9757_005776 [Collybiopsis confluens]|uniref:Serine/threonine-protein kinase TEL1 n=1 Tax=Collybiopsis confluens TaxID=2823264 RepID=A0A8H5HPY5_9AGAR|nr:hypothetical protein D9757_005776 [Collybiopsis confluens]